MENGIDGSKTHLQLSISFKSRDVSDGLLLSHSKHTHLKSLHRQLLEDFRHKKTKGRRRIGNILLTLKI